MQLIREINLSAQVGANSHYDKGGALVIENVTVFTPGEFVGERGTVVNISAEAVPATNWVNLLQGRPLIEGHSEVHSSNYGELIRGTVKAVKVEGQAVVADIIIADKSLQNKIITGELRSVSLSFVWNEELKKIDYINHLGVVKLGQVPEAVIHLSKNKGGNMEEKNNDQDKEKILNLEKQVEELTKQVNEFKGKEATFNFAAKQSKAVQVALEKQEQDWKGKYEVAIECLKIGLTVNLSDVEGMTKMLLDHKEKIVKEYLPGTPGDLDTLFNVALSLQERAQAEAENRSIAKVDAGNLGFHEIMQNKAIKNH